ncbi:MAG: hypothetical protein CVV42_12495 [Candidatus Riflebacteria bacterium HGW-Riflebacteria-2]|jgi:hypothetical protein|nr:MAG: hypothetical protein CVV42_12495 [Candidatus Riflebacteria bacterium HGW-Riflebacteria-2]
MQNPDKPENKDAPEPAEDDVYKRLNAFRPPECKLKKHPCKDCFNCLFCSDARCEICLKSKSCHDNEKKDDKSSE